MRRGEGPIVLIVAPTREVARQIEQEAKQFATRGIRMCCVYVGVRRQIQESEFRNGVEIIICTPGRMLDFVVIILYFFVNPLVRGVM